MAARSSFEAALQQEASPEALLGLGTALWWLGETDAAVRAQTRAYAQFRRRPDPVAAAFTAISLCFTYRASLGNYAVSRGWVGAWRGWSSSTSCRRCGDGSPSVATAILDRRLREFGEQCVESAPLCELLVEVEIAMGDAEAATARAARLAECGGGRLRGSPPRVRFRRGVGSARPAGRHGRTALAGGAGSPCPPPPPGP